MKISPGPGFASGFVVPASGVAVYLAEVDDEGCWCPCRRLPSAAVLSSTLLAFRISVPPWLRMPPALAEVWRGVGPPGFKSVNMVNLSYWLLLTLSRSANHRSSDEVMEPAT